MIMMNTTEIQLEIESECLLNCRHCSLDLHQVTNKIGYTLEEVIKFIRLFQNPVYVTLTGGEPLLNSNLKQIINLLNICKPDTHLGMFTSGVICTDNGIEFISRKSADELKAAGLSSCYVSIYHTEAHHHNYITNANDSFQCTMQTIQNFISAGIVVKSHLVLTRNNINSLETIVSDLGEIGVSEVRLLRLVNTGNAAINWPDIGVAYEQQEDMIQNIYKARNDFKAAISISGFPDIAPCRVHNGSQRCQAGINLFYVTFHGDVYPCACTRNIIKYKITHMTQSKELQKHIIKNKTKYINKCLKDGL